MLRGIGEKTAAVFEKAGVFTAEDLLRYYPVHYVHYEDPVPCGAAAKDGIVSVRGRITKRPAMRKGRRVSIVSSAVSDLTGSLDLVWFNAPYIVSMLRYGSEMVFRGRVSARGSRLVMEHPAVFTADDYESVRGKLLPAYSLTRGLRNGTVVRAVKDAFLKAAYPEDFLPEGARSLYCLMPEEEAVRNIHFPDSEETLLAARRRLVFDEFLLFLLAIRRMKEDHADRRPARPVTDRTVPDRAVSMLPYSLTGAQKKAYEEIVGDMTSGHAMNRLLEGDVGSGKTILAFLSMLLCVSNGWQAVMMAPTEVLAAQHYRNLLDFLETAGDGKEEPVLLTGSLSASEKKKRRQEIAEGKARMIIGTHALIQEGVTFPEAGLVITDEQHRFGVMQRGALTEGEFAPHILVMSATPIPRTLGVIYYGDLSLSVLDEKPQNRLPVKNCVIGREKRDAAWRFLEKETAKGRQAYVICPLVEENDALDMENVGDYTEKLKEAFPGLKISSLHGRMRPSQKEAVMRSFAEGEVSVLVSTTVVEVGVDVPNATVMIVEDAERFGLAQLHQLRGRIGRGKEQSYCIFIHGESGEAAEERLSVLSASNDGFAIAEKDFALRGPGDLLGIRQSGDLHFSLADVSADGAILKDAAELSGAVLGDDPSLLFEEHAPLRKALDAYMERTIDRIVI